MRKAAARNAVPRRPHGPAAWPAARKERKSTGDGRAMRRPPAAARAAQRLQPGGRGRGLLCGRNRNSSSERPVTA
jgi:hypothetical protein